MLLLLSIFLLNHKSENAIFRSCVPSIFFSALHCARSIGHFSSSASSTKDNKSCVVQSLKVMMFLCSIIIAKARSNNFLANNFSSSSLYPR